MSFVFLPNLSAQLVAPCEPWTSAYLRPQMASKNAFREWCNNPLTDHAFISAVTGVSPTLRVSESNPPHQMSGLILDYDAIPPGQPEFLLLNNAPPDLRPAYVSRTFSGNCRVIYRFESPQPIFGLEYGREFVKKCQKELMLKKLLPGFEEEALRDLAKHYEIGESWVPVGDGSAVISNHILSAWMTWASAKVRWDTQGPVIGVEALKEEGQKRFPDRWPGGWDKFEFNIRGPRFWDESASDPMAAIVRESGMQYFSDGGGFMSWEAIFGAAFIRKFNDNRKGAAIANVWYDGKEYWQKTMGGLWACTNKGDMAADLRIGKGLSISAAKTGEASEVDQALYDIRHLKRVKAAGPFLYRPDGVYNFNGVQYLNTSTLRPIEPVVDLVTDCENWPWIAEFLSSFFDPEDQLDYFLSWLKHFYVGAITQNPQRGLATFIAGPVGVGKTMLNKGIIGQLMGGSQDAGSFLVGGDKFNDPLLGAPLWTIDDEVLAGDQKQRNAFAQMVKKIVANDRLTMRAMHKSGVDMEWRGRAVITLNDDPESLRILPDIEVGNADKTNLHKSKKPSVTTWPTDAQLAAELPFFGAFLRDMEVPEHCRPPADNPRFGVMPYKHPDLVVVAGSSSPSASFEELLQLWRKDWFAPGGPGENEQVWTGNPTGLHASGRL
jgi:hypothetical protein